MLAQEIDMAEAEHLDLNERYSSLEEERDGKTRFVRCGAQRSRWIPVGFPRPPLTCPSNFVLPL